MGNYTQEIPRINLYWGSIIGFLPQIAGPFALETVVLEATRGDWRALLENHLEQWQAL